MMTTFKEFLSESVKKYAILITYDEGNVEDVELRKWDDITKGAEHPSFDHMIRLTQEEDNKDKAWKDFVKFVKKHNKGEKLPDDPDEDPDTSFTKHGPLSSDKIEDMMDEYEEFLGVAEEKEPYNAFNDHDMISKERRKPFSERD